MTIRADSNFVQIHQNVTELPAEENLARKKSNSRIFSVARQCIYSIYYNWIYSMGSTIEYQCISEEVLRPSARASGDSSSFFDDAFERLEEEVYNPTFLVKVLDNPNAYVFDKKMGLRKASRFERVTNYVYAYFGRHSFEKLMEKVVAFAGGEEKVAAKMYSYYAETFADDKFIDDLKTLCDFGVGLENVASDVLSVCDPEEEALEMPSNEDIKALMRSVHTPKEMLQAMEIVLDVRSEGYKSMKKNPIFSEETLELVEASILQLAEDVIRLKDEEEAFRNLFADVSSNQHIHDQPLVATKRYYQDRVVGDTGEFTLNGNYGDVRALSAFLHDNSFDEDEEWRKALELMLTQEAYMGFSHLSAQAYSQGNHLEVIQKCDVIMEKVADEEVRVQIAFPVHVKSKEWLPEAIELQARKEFCLRKEEGKIALIDYKARLV